MSFPAALSALQDNVDSIIAAHINNIESAIGITGSAVNSSINYKLGNVRAGEKVWEVGDIILTSWDTAKAGWLICNGDTIGNVGSGATHESADYQTLFGYLQTKFGLTPTAAWGSGGRIALPDARGRFILGVSASHAIHSTGGSEDIDLSHVHIVDSHTHTGPSHTHATVGHTLTIGEMPSHTHEQDPHDHTYYFSDAGGTNNYGEATGPNNDVHRSTSSTTAVNKNTGGGSAHDHGNTTASGTGITGTASPSTDEQLSNAQSIMPPFIAMNFIIKY